jgi:hypothetical protein
MNRNEIGMINYELTTHSEAQGQRSFAHSLYRLVVALSRYSDLAAYPFIGTRHIIPNHLVLWCISPPKCHDSIM